MKKYTFIYLAFIAFLFALQSCATDPLIRRNITGTWIPDKLGTMDMKKVIPDGDTAAPQYTESDYKALTDMKEFLSKKGPDGSMVKSTSNDFDQMIFEANTVYMFGEDGFGGRMNAVQPIKGPWKLKKKGTRVVMTDNITKEQFVLIIDSLSSRKMIATNKNLPDGIKITYKKESDEY